MTDDIDVREAGRVSVAVLLDAVHDLELRIPKCRQEYASNIAANDARFRRRAAAALIQAAVDFFEDMGGNFRWMAAGLGVERQDGLRALRARLLSAKDQLKRHGDQEAEASARSQPAEEITSPLLCGPEAREDRSGATISPE